MSNIRYEFTEAERELFRPKLLYLTESKYESDWHSTPHFHPFMEIIFVTAGRGRFLIEENACDISRGDVVIINPNKLHTEQSTDVNPMEYIILGVDGMAFDILKDEEEADTPFFPVFHFSHVYDRVNYYLSEMYREIQQKSANYQLVIQSLLMVFTVFLMRHTNLKTTIPDPTHMSKECAFIKDYLDCHYNMYINLDDLASKTFLSKYHLIHAFKRFTGMSPINYLIEKRIAEAKCLLTSTGLSVTAISRSVGFSSPAHFAQRFKSSVGQTPAEYRSRQNEKSLSPHENAAKEQHEKEREGGGGVKEIVFYKKCPLCTEGTCRFGYLLDLRLSSSTSNTSLHTDSANCCSWDTRIMAPS